MKNMFQTIKTNINTLKNEKGAMSIPFIIVMLVVVIFIAGYLDTTRISLVTEEVQGIMDISGVAALREGLDEAAMEEEQDKLIYNESVIKSTFIGLLDEQITTHQEGPIISYRVNTLNVTEIKDDKWGQGQTTRNRNQLVLEAVITVVVPLSSNMFDTHSERRFQFHDQINNTDFEIVSRNIQNDNRETIVIRSVTRLVK